MRAFVVEFAGADDELNRGILPGRVAALASGDDVGVDRGSRGLGELHGHEAAVLADPEAGEPH
jgi:hypothetical protein